MAIYNKEVERSIFTKIGDDVKDAALKKSLKRRKTLAIAGLVILIIGALFLLFDFVLYDTTTLLYVIASIITALGLVLLILAPSLHAATKKKYSYDSYNYGQEHYPEVLSQITSGKAGELTPLQRVIIYVDELKQAEIVLLRKNMKVMEEQVSVIQVSPIDLPIVMEERVMLLLKVPTHLP